MEQLTDVEEFRAVLRIHGPALANQGGDYWVAEGVGLLKAAGIFEVLYVFPACDDLWARFFLDNILDGFIKFSVKGDGLVPDLPQDHPEAVNVHFLVDFL